MITETGSKWRLFVLGSLLILIGLLTAHFTQTAGGINIKDVRFTSPAGKTYSALLYVPENATETNKAPGILAVHGYINSREVQSAFAIEYARRGYVVLTPDQAGHGYSDGPAFGDGFGGPASLAYLRDLPYVDTDNIGLEGHSMGGWTVLAAATASPDDYKSMVLEGSSVGAPFASEGTPEWPRNVAIVFSKYDEFSETMWAVKKGREIGASPKLKTLFASETNIQPDRVYGDLAEGTARILHQPNVTHAGDHISTMAVAHSIDWFGKTLEGGNAIPAHRQIWMFKELGTALALVGFVFLILGSFTVLLSMRVFTGMNNEPRQHAFERRNKKWWILAIVSAVLPVLTYYPIFGLSAIAIPASALLPQDVTTQITLWAVVNGLLLFALGFALKGQRVETGRMIAHSVGIALLTAIIAYIYVWLSGAVFNLDFRFWMVGVKALSLNHFKITLIYILPLTLFFYLAFRGLNLGLSVSTDSMRRRYVSNILVLAGGFLLFLCLQYGWLFAQGQLMMPMLPLFTIIMIQFVPILAFCAIVGTYTYQRTASILPGAFLCGLIVTWYIVAGQATQF